MKLIISLQGTKEGRNYCKLRIDLVVVDEAGDVCYFCIKVFGAGWYRRCIVFERGHRGKG